MKENELSQMTDFYEIDFLDVASSRSGDAIPLRYKLNGETHIHIVDGGFVNTGPKVVNFVNKYYGKPEIRRRAKSETKL